jgi:hypothetical protein
MNLQVLIGIFNIQRMCCTRIVVYTRVVASRSDRDRLGLFLTTERQFSGSAKEQNLSGFVFGNRQGHDSFGCIASFPRKTG